MFFITPKRQEDAAYIEILLDKAFGPDRLAKTSYQYRRDAPPVEGLSFVARDGARIVGAIAYWPVAIGAAATPALLLGPLAVDPARQHEGVGGALMNKTLNLAATGGHRIVLLVGDLAYYRRFGFRPASPLGVEMPGERPERLQVRELADGALRGVAGVVQPVRVVPRVAPRPRAREILRG